MNHLFFRFGLWCHISLRFWFEFFGVEFFLDDALVSIVDWHALILLLTGMFLSLLMNHRYMFFFLLNTDAIWRNRRIKTSMLLMESYSA